MRVLLIDNTDSFTWNLAQQIQALGAECQVVGNTQMTVSEIARTKPDRIVLSPGPGRPESAGVSLDILRTLADTVPILGVCLGHQCIAHVFGGKTFVGPASEVMHGKTSQIRHTQKSIFQGVPSPFSAARYHSLIVKKLPKNYEILALTEILPSPGCSSEPGGGVGGGGTGSVIMAMKHATLPIIGVQFHPESFLTNCGDRIMNNFLLGRW